MNNRPSVFVAMSFDSDADDLFELVIKHAIESCGYRCVRLDKEPFTGSILGKITSEISKASLLIAELTGANPNVFLEIGFAWGCGCPTILLARKEDENALPFDVRDQKVLIYEKLAQLKELLVESIENIKSKVGSQDHPIALYVSDITELESDAIVNATNSDLSEGAGVSKAIHQKAGPELLEACVRIPEIQPDVRCPISDARITDGYKLPARFVIHTVGPVYSRGDTDEALLLAACYWNCLILANQYNVESIAFPAISTGAYGYPKDKAAQIAVHTVVEWLKRHLPPRRIVFCCFEKRDAMYYVDVFRNLDVQWCGEGA